MTSEDSAHAHIATLSDPIPDSPATRPEFIAFSDNLRQRLAGDSGTVSVTREADVSRFEVVSEHAAYASRYAQEQAFCCPRSRVGQRSQLLQPARVLSDARRVAG